MQPLAEKLKIALKNAGGLGVFSILRWSERRLSVKGLYRVLRPLLHARAALNTVFKMPATPAILPDCLRTSNALSVRIQKRTRHYLNGMSSIFPDRLAEAKWQDRCRMEGLGFLEAARQNGRPVILAFCHFGPYHALRPWLRAAGFPAAVFLSGKAENRTRLRRFKDRFSIEPGVPLILYQDQWREAAEFLNAGNPLLVAVDVPRGKQALIPFCEGWSFGNGRRRGAPGHAPPGGTDSVQHYR